MNLKEALGDKLSKDEQRKLIRSFDVIGDMAIIKIPPELEDKARLIGETILVLHKNLRVVARQTGTCSGEYRTIPLTIIAGEDRKETIHREYGTRMILNPEKVYFSPRLATERKRIADCVRDREKILVCFSGVGAFPLVIAQNSRAGKIVGIEKNSIAHEYARKSLQLNRKISTVTLLQGDVNDILPGLSSQYDRLLMPFPTAAHLFLPRALPALKPGGRLHFYSFQHHDTLELAIDQLQKECEKLKRTLIKPTLHRCGHCGTRLYRVCVDGRIDP